MTALHTRPILRQAPAVAHEHAWTAESRHRTSDGTVVYVRCTGCAARRVDLQQDSQRPPAGISRSIPRP
ncbi:hypothetical protein MZK47_14580 [Microbacterium aerolatum]|uniref:hypothetical protein n=1 Tax=Microbacterium aerolatum TaxID=153731 RepID=UPI00200198B6|nr:hypothetical protein [Microbacterium aerolatum]MCK3770902.1 hypothetical protein [Microbacterium aerolatum]